MEYISGLRDGPQTLSYAVSSLKDNATIQNSIFIATINVMTLTSRCLILQFEAYPLKKYQKRENRKHSSSTATVQTMSKIISDR